MFGLISVVDEFIAILFRRLRNFAKSDLRAKTSDNMTRCSARTSPLILTGSLLAALLFTAACGNSKEAKAAAPQAMPVKVQTAKAQKVDDTTDYVATLKSRDSALVMPQVEGIITQIYVHSGQRVDSGAPMMQIDPARSAE